ncbi:MAG: hypothetical protein N3D77_02160 [Geminicoccaceae bacterium]|nr:hypothetical protein [Geminicoccaceae bacterium]
MSLGRRLACALALLALLAARPAAAGEGPGAALWRDGLIEGRPVVARLGPAGPELRGAAVACARCHGAEAEGGGGEGGVRAPPLLRRGTRPSGLDAAALARALEGGIGRDGRRLHPAMPRYELEPAALAALLAELDRLGQRSVEGVSPRRLRFATVWPNAAAREALLPLFERYRALVAAEGGIVHREFELLLLPVEPGAALRRLEAEPALALLLDDAPPALLAALRERGTIELFPIRPAVGPEPASVRRLGPPRSVEARLLLEAMARDLGGRGRIGLLAEPALEAELLSQLARWPGLERVARGRPGEPLDALLLLAPVEPARLSASRLYAPVDLLARLGTPLPTTVESLVASDPRALPPGSPAPSERARALMGEAEASSPLARHATAALLLLETALRRLGRDVTRARLLAALDGLGLVTTGLVPPWSARPGPEAGAALVRLDRRSGERRVEPWRRPGDPLPAGATRSEE